jgi:hypothetical protein
MTETVKPIASFVHTDAASTWANSPERVPLFDVTRPGIIPDDAVEGYTPEPIVETFTMPAKPNPGLALDFLRRARKQGDVAMAWLIETAVGEAGYDALIEELAGVEDGAEATRILQSIVEKIQRVAMGGLEGKV